jgi:hypothetical protein
MIVAAPEHPSETVARLRRKLEAYGEPCYSQVRPELEYLQQCCEAAQRS